MKPRRGRGSEVGEGVGEEQFWYKSKIKRSLGEVGEARLGKFTVSVILM